MYKEVRVMVGKIGRILLFFFCLEVMYNWYINEIKGLMIS